MRALAHAACTAQESRGPRAGALTGAMLPRMKRRTLVSSLLALVVLSSASAQDAPLPEGALRRLGDPAFLHDGTVLVVAWSGERLLTAGGGGAALWEVPSGQRTARLGLPDGLLARFLSVSRDGALVADSTGDAKVGVWSVAEAKLLFEVTCPDIHQVSALAFSPDGRTVAVGGGTEVLWLDVETRALTGRTKISEGGVHGLAFDPAGARLAVRAIYEPGVVFVDVEGRRVTSTLEIRGLEDVRFSPDGATLCTVSGGAVTLWDAARARTRVTSDAHGALAAEVGADGRVYTASNSGVVRCLDGKTLAERWQGKDPGMLKGLALSPDGKHVASAGCDARVRVRDAATGTALNADLSESGFIRDIQYSPDGSQLAWVGASDAQVWDVASGRQLRRFETTPGPKALGFRSAEELVVVEGTYRGVIRLASLKDGTTRVLVSTQEPFRTVASPQGAGLIAVRDDAGAVQVISLADGATRALAPVDRDGYELALRADGQRLFEAGAQLRAWDVAAGSVLWSAKGPFLEVATSLGGERVAATHLHTWKLELFDGVTGKPQPAPDAGEKVFLRSLTLSRDGRRLAATTGDALLVWRLADDGASWSPPRRLAPGAPGPVALAFSPDGATLAAGTRDGLVTVWRVAGP